MKKQDKIRKKTADESNAINKIKNCVNRYAAKASYVRSVAFEEQTDKDNIRFTARLDCCSFEQRIIYYPDTMPSENSIDTELSFENSVYVYTFYDIFNLFDIDDFNLYYYGDLANAEEINNAVKAIFDATEKYLHYIERAQTAEYLPALEKNYEADMTAVTGDDSWKDEERDLFFLPANHPIYSYADGDITPKLHKKLKKKSNKGELDIIYEKRLLKFLDGGNTVERKELKRKNSFDKLYFRKELLIGLIIFAAAFVVAFVLSIAVHLIAFKGAELLEVRGFVRDRAIPLPVNLAINSVFSALCITPAIWYIFGKNIIVKYMPDNMKRRAEDEYDSQIKFRHIKWPELYRLVFALIFVAFSFAFFFVSFDGVGYYDDFVRFTEQSSYFKTVDVSYEELEIYRVQYDYVGRHNSYQPVENSYIIADGSGNYYNYGELNPNGKTQAKLNEIAEKYNKEIIEVESVDYIS